MRRLGLSYQACQRYALRRDEDRAHAFWSYMHTYYTFDQILVGDETSKQIGVLRQQRAWGPRGYQPFVRDTVLSRGRRISTLAYFSSRGFEAWRHVPNTYNAAKFQIDTDDMLTTPDPTTGESLADQFAVCLLDNASIHKYDEYLKKLEGHIKILFIPPYCYHLSPLDNGAFGYVTRHLKLNADYYSNMPIEQALNEAFRHVNGDASIARWCFHNCMYRAP